VSADSESVRVRLLEREFRIACPPGESAGVLRAAELLEARMQEVRREGLVGLDRIAVVVALNLAHERIELEKKQTEQSEGGGALERLRALNRRLALRLAGEEPAPSKQH
jgi:cell division protein ZapA